MPGLCRDGAAPLPATNAPGSALITNSTTGGFGMARVVGIDHIVLRVGDYERSKAFYGKLLGFLGFKILEEYDEAIGWTNGKTRLWIGPADAEGRKHKHR